MQDRCSKIVKEKKLKEIKCLLVTNHGVNVNSNVAMMTINLDEPGALNMDYTFYIVIHIKDHHCKLVILVNPRVCKEGEAICR